MHYDNRETAKTAGTAGRSQTARAALDAGQLTLDQAAIVAEFDAEGDTAAIEKLLGARYDFRWTAQRLLNDRAERKARAEAGIPYAERGFTVLEEEPAYGDPYLRADDLVTADGGPVTDAVIDGAAGHWALWLSKEERYTLTATGEIIEEDSIDWDTEDNLSAEPEAGLHHHKDIGTAEVWVPEYFTSDPDAAGVKPGPILAAALAAPAGDVDPPTPRQSPRPPSRSGSPPRLQRRKPRGPRVGAPRRSTSHLSPRQWSARSSCRSSSPARPCRRVPRRGSPTLSSKSRDCSPRTKPPSTSRSCLVSQSTSPPPSGGATGKNAPHAMLWHR